MSEATERDRWRCTVVGCNPVMLNIEVMESHQAEAVDAQPPGAAGTNEGDRVD